MAKNEETGIEDDSTSILGEGIKEEERIAAPKFKTVDFKGSLAEYMSKMMIEEDNKKPESSVSDVVIFTVKDKEDMDAYIDDKSKRSDKDYIEDAVYIKSTKDLKASVSLENDLTPFINYLKIKNVPILRTEEEVKEFYDEVTSLECDGDNNEES